MQNHKNKKNKDRFRSGVYIHGEMVTASVNVTRRKAWNFVDNLQNSNVEISVREDRLRSRVYSWGDMATARIRITRKS